MRRHFDRTAEARAFILAPQRWPVFPFLPIKRYETATEQLKEMELGVLYAPDVLDDEPVNVLLTNICAIDLDAPTKRYLTVDQLLADGWEVD